MHTYCRLCEGACGLLAHVDGGRLSALEGDRTDPVSGGYICPTATASIAALRHPERITAPLRREGGALVPATWEEALADIGERLRTIRGQTGARSVGVYLGDEVSHASKDWVRSLAFGVSMGTSAIFSEQCMGAGPRVRVTELMIGHPTVLLPDVGRAHYVLLLDGEQEQAGWGPMQAGEHVRALEHSRKTKGTRVVVASSRKTPLADKMDQHLPIRPGTEPFLLLGMLSAIVSGSWYDAQYIADYTSGFERLTELLAPWGVARCAEICGLPRAVLSGVALKFSRAAMGVVHPGHSAFNNASSALGAWAWLALHTVTANTLRPGGIYEHAGALDLHPLLASIPTADAPRTRTGGHPLLLMQAPATVLADEVLTPGEGQVRALVVVSGDPAGRLPATGRVTEALEALDLLVCCSRTHNATTAHADWVLPTLHPWERADLTLHNSMLLPVTGLLATPALVEPAGQTRSVEDILKALHAVVHPGLRGSVWGRHLGLIAQYLSRTELSTWEERVVDWASDVEIDDLAAEPHRALTGATDRSLWRPSTPDARIDLLPEAIAGMLSRLEPPATSDAMPLRLRTSRRTDRAPDAHHRAAPEPRIALHPDRGVREGQRVEVVTRHGRLSLPVRLDPTLRPDTVDVSAAEVPGALTLLGGERIDPLTGAPELDGLACCIVTN